ncbi:MAG: Crp/Fnr family transcriptional regulator [Gammaproteobacteria bacterium]|nr:Crp/Fnr family transcriptional regulator [Gammaproteobacteria bacterium]
MNRYHNPPVDLDDISALLARQALFKRVDRAALRGLAANVHMLRVPRRELLVKSGQCINEIYVVVDGTLKLYLLAQNGQQRVIRLLQEGAGFGEELLINQMPSPLYAEALTNCQVLAIPAPDLFDLLSSQRQMAMDMVQLLSGKIQQLMGDLEGCCLQSSVQRIAQYLYGLNDHNHQANNQIQLPASKAVIASLLNLTPETLSRGFHQLAEAQLIAIDRRQVRLLDPEGLKAVFTG